MAAIHQAALDVLQDLGIKVLLPEAVELFEKHGAAASGDMLRIGSDMVDAALSSAPQSFTLRAPNRAGTADLHLRWRLPQCQRRGPRPTAR